MLQNNLAQQQSLVSKLTDMQLGQELNKPSGLAPTYLIMSEMQKRQMMRQDAIQPGAGSNGTIRQEMAQQASANQQTPIAQMGQTAPMQDAGYPGPAPAAPGVGIAPVAAMRRTRGYADGGDVTMPDMTGAGQFGLFTPGQTMQYEQQYLPQYMKMMGMGQAPGPLSQYQAQVNQSVPDPSQAYNQPINQLQNIYAQAQAQGKGTALMKAGLAMMTAPTGNFLTALGAGGMAGLDSYQQSLVNQRQIQAQLSQAQIAAANAKQQAALHSLDAAASLRNQDMESYQRSMGLAQNAAGQALDANRTAATLGEHLQATQTSADADIQGHQISAGAELQAANISASKAEDIAKLQYGERGEAAFNRAFAQQSDQLTKSLLNGIHINPITKQPYTPQDVDQMAASRALTMVNTFAQANGQQPKQLAPSGIRGAIPPQKNRPPLSAFSQ